MTEAKKVWTWWMSLRGIALFNILLWTVTCLPMAADASGYLAWQVALSGIYVAVCAFRSWLPRIDLERYCLVDSPWSSPVLGRSAATVAEICFAVQVAMCVHQVGVMSQVPWIVQASFFIVPPLVLAQFFCWHSVLTLSHLGHAIEASLWTATVALVGICLTAAAGALDGNMSWYVSGGAAIAFGFVAFMVTIDVPMYLARWRRARVERRAFLSLRAGFTDALRRRVETREWAVWRPEIAWLTGYFSFAVWLSVSFVHFTLP